MDRPIANPPWSDEHYRLWVYSEHDLPVGEARIGQRGTVALLRPTSGKLAQ
jgi:hypothetical protein